MSLSNGLMLVLYRIIHFIHQIASLCCEVTHRYFYKRNIWKEVFQQRLTKT